MLEVRDGSNYADASAQVRIFEVSLFGAEVASREVRSRVDLACLADMELGVQLAVRRGLIHNDLLLLVLPLKDLCILRVALRVSKGWTVLACTCLFIVELAFFAWRTTCSIIRWL